MKTIAPLLLLCAAFPAFAQEGAEYQTGYRFAHPLLVYGGISTKVVVRNPDFVQPIPGWQNTRDPFRYGDECQLQGLIEVVMKEDRILLKSIPERFHRANFGTCPYGVLFFVPRADYARMIERRRLEQEGSAARDKRVHDEKQRVKELLDPPKRP
jgi:hypothetical protein